MQTYKAYTFVLIEIQLQSSLEELCTHLHFFTLYSTDFYTVENFKSMHLADTFT